jgi:alkanesulfonate monooxygenase SsuD/methylene tetrahydromethanopterin reductase-like flavin-dependent oxidoreductase (luciferase family)
MLLFKRYNLMNSGMYFGIYLRGAEVYEKMLEMALAVEDLGYFGVFLNDHIEGLSGDRKEPYIEAWTAMTGIGVQTRKIRIGHITLFNSLRNPAYLAKSISTLDQMTGGRYEFIIGAGWNEPEYVGYDLMGEGRGMPSASERVSRLKESVEITKGMLRNEVFNYDGKYWKLKEAINVPQPVQKPFRISIGARQPRMISISAKYADGINASGNLQNVQRILEHYKNDLKSFGKTIDDVFISGFVPSVYLFKDDKEYEETLLNWKMRGTNIENTKKYDFVGTADILIDKWRQAIDIGMDMSIINVQPSKNIQDNIEMLANFKDKVSTQL